MNDQNMTTGEWSKSWKVVAVSFLAMSISVTHLYSFGIFLPSLEKDFAWSRTEATLGLTIMSVMSVCLSPFVGVLIDRYGSRRIGVPGILIYCLAIAGLSYAGPSIVSWWIAWIFVAFGSLSIKPTVWTAATATLFTERRGVAIAIVLCGTGLGSTMVPLLAAMALEQLGRQNALLALAAVDAVIALPLAWLYFYDARDQSRRQKPAVAARRPDRALRQTGRMIPAEMTSSRFIKLAIISLGSAIGATAMVIPFVPIMTEKGLSVTHAAATAGLIGIGAISGRLGAGFLLDRLSGTLIGFCSFVPQSVGCAILLYFTTDHIVAAVIAFLLGLGMGAATCSIAYMTSRHFDLHHYGLIFGTFVGIQSLGAGLGPLFSGFVHDRFGGYGVVTTLTIPMFLLCSILIGTLGKYPPLTPRLADRS